MTKLELINESSTITGLSKVETELVLDSILNTIKLSLSNAYRIP